MKIFLMGLPGSGRTTVAKSFDSTTYKVIDAFTWYQKAFDIDSLNEEQAADLISNQLKINPLLFINKIKDDIALFNQVDKVNNFVIDGIKSPRDFIDLFDYNKDYVVFLNRIDNNFQYKDHDTIAISVMRDYCYWLSSADLLPKDRWLEFNFKIPGEVSDTVKVLGSKNTVYIIRSFERVISQIKEIFNRLNLQS